MNIILGLLKLFLIGTIIAIFIITYIVIKEIINENKELEEE